MTAWISCAMKLRPAVEAYDEPWDRNPGSVLLEANQNNRRVILASRSYLRIYKRLIKSLGRNVIVGKENFFTVAAYWKFFVEKQWLLLETLEWVKAAGLVYFFLHEADKALEKRWVNNMRSKLSPNEKDNRVGFSEDSVC